ncbi:MAG: UPF0149 family protein [Proteobacteria bacterium]|nr:UPF0149 family protein [Pseudomonadota bacterium]
MNATSTPLTEAELDRLAARLASDALADAMPLDAVQGLLFALASGPQPMVAPPAWLPLALGDNPQWASDDERADTEALLVRFADDCARDIREAEDSLPLILFGDDDEPDYATWCAGYLDGVDLPDARWYAEGDADVLDEYLAPVRVLAGELADGAPDSREHRAAVRAARADLEPALIDLWHYWFERRIAREPVRRDAPKLGRNDPCHCGSGRKFKQCHGRA